jgi:hypothetical protein
MQVKLVSEDMGYAGDSRADGEIAAQVSFLAHALVEKVSPACAVYLTGSFARGEGSVIPWGGTWRPLGDFDFYLVCTAPVAASSLADHLAAVWADRYGGAGPSFGISVDAVRESALAGLPPDTSTFEFRELARLLWGREVRGRITFGRRSLPSVSGTRALLNKLLGLLLHAPWADGFSPPGLEYEVWKLYLDAVAALLLMEGRFVSGYRRRAAIFQQLGRRWEETGVSDLRGKAEWALTRKLRPVFSAADHDGLWDEARSDLRALLLHSLGVPTTHSPSVDIARLVSWLQASYYEGWTRPWLRQRIGRAPEWLVRRMAAVACRREAHRFQAPAAAHVPAALYGAAAWCLNEEGDEALAEAGRLLRSVGIAPGVGRAGIRSTILQASERCRRTKHTKRGFGV